MNMISLTESATGKEFSVNVNSIVSIGQGYNHAFITLSNERTIAVKEEYAEVTRLIQSAHLPVEVSLKEINSSLKYIAERLRGVGK